MDTFHDQYKRAVCGPATPLGVLDLLAADVRVSIYKFVFAEPITKIRINPVYPNASNSKEDDRFGSDDDDEDNDAEEDDFEEEHALVKRFGGLPLTSRVIYNESYYYMFSNNLELERLADPCDRDPEAPYRLPRLIIHRISHILIQEVFDETPDLDCAKFPNLKSVEIQTTFSEDDGPDFRYWDVHDTGTGAEIAELNRSIAEGVYYYNYRLPLMNFKEDLKIEAMAYRVDAEYEREIAEEKGHNFLKRYDKIWG